MEEWEKITREEIQALIDTMPDRVQAVITAQGGAHSLLGEGAHIQKFTSFIILYSS